MSKISLSPSASGTGTFTIASPNSNTDRTLTLPDNTGTILTSASNTNFPAGSVLQVVQAVQNTQASSSSTTAVTTGLTGSITPSSSSNKILVFANIQGIYKNNSSSGNGVVLYLYRNGSLIREYTNSVAYTTAAATNYVGGNALLYLDTPTTTSSTTYTIYFSSTNTQPVTVQNNGDYSTITFMEIKA